MRVKLKSRTDYTFCHNTRVEVTDINYGGHLGNMELVGLLHRARVWLLQSLGCTEHDLGDGKTGLIMTDLVVNYKAEGFLLDPLQVHSAIDGFTRSGFRVFQRVTRQADTLALAESGMICFDYGTRAIVPVPETFLAALKTAGTAPA